ncbi:putative Pol polyprotein from transposon element Bs1 [Hordeum vulgare]|nr:putative Pol polyprotein from transposon element Bs1 [Hordeum vulgare]
MAGTQDVSLITQNSTLEGGSLAGFAAFGSRTTTLSVHDEEEMVAVTVGHGGDGNEPSGRYILVSGRADEKDGLRQVITGGVLKPGITYRVAGWISLVVAGAASRGTSHPVRVNLGVAMDDDESESLQVERQLNYADADALLALCDRLGKRVRGHCVFWSVEGDVQQWVKSLDKDQLKSAVQSRLKGLVSRYAGKFSHYDVNNEMLHGQFFRDRLGDEDVPAFMFKEVARLDPEPALFVNDFNVECVVRGIGIQGHVTSPVVEVICAALDRLATTGVPVWFTELDVSEPDVNLRAKDLEVVLREAYAHPAVEGIVLWGFMQGTMWRQDAWLVDADGTVNEPARCS